MCTNLIKAWLVTLSAALFAGACNGEVEVFSTSGAGGSEDAGIDGAAGSEAAAGAAGSGGEPTPVAHVEKLDLLLMLDNSASMADKQSILADTIPSFIDRLTSPLCVDEAGAVIADLAPSEACPDGSFREFPPVTDMHVGVITSSLGGHGADSCSNVATQNWNPRQQDMAHLLERGAQGPVETYESLGFLNWDPGATDTPPGQANAQTFATRLADIARGAGQEGCGFESSLEAWYRFLVDPTPYERMTPVPCFDGDDANQCRGPEGVDEVVLQQRDDFLRQDSAVAIVMLTDENDCSVIDGGQNFVALQALDGTGSFHLAPGTNACDTDPHGPECKSCWEVNAADYPECQLGWPDPQRDDALNLRCYRQKQRFGIDFLYPVERYIAALTETHLDDGRLNPLFCKTPEVSGGQCTTPLRSRTQVVLTGIVGVPWQDIAIDPGNLSAGYRRAQDIDWELILGNPGSLVEPEDPLMLESIDPRTGAHPLTNAPLAAPGSGVQNPINGAEREIPARNDLQYACIFELPEPLDCTLQENAFGCDCNTPNASPLCWDGSSYGQMQHYGKAYPGHRHLSVLQGIASQAVVASICAPNLREPDQADYGYRAALDALTSRLADNLR